MDDAMFPAYGIRAAHDKLTHRYTQAGARTAYLGTLGLV